MACIVVGQRSWKCSRDEIGYRNYRIKFLVRGTTLDGPANALQAAGLPTFGSMWAIGNDVDAWAFCHWDAEVTQVVENEPNNYFEVDILFSTKPPKFWCHEFPLTDYTLEPPKISGSFIRYTREATIDQFGRPLVNSAHEVIRGPQVEFDDNRPQISIEQNVASAYMAYILPSQLVNSVNAYPIWGFPPRCVKLCDASWELRYWGVCFAYYMRRLVFDVRYPTEIDPGFDRYIGDEGTKVLNGHWNSDGVWQLDNINGVPPNPYNPQHFAAYIDNKGNRARTPLNGRGIPAQAITGSNSLFVSIKSPNIGLDFSDDTHWVPLNNIIVDQDTNEWVLGQNYDRGDVVSITTKGAGIGVLTTSDVYLSINNYVESAPEEPGQTDWIFLGTIQWVAFAQILVQALVDKGKYKPNVNYPVGNYVKDAQRKTGAAFRLLQHYPQADFTRLGIPLAF